MQDYERGRERKREKAIWNKDLETLHMMDTLIRGLDQHNGTEEGAPREKESRKNSAMVLLAHMPVQTIFHRRMGSKSYLFGVDNSLQVLHCLLPLPGNELIKAEGRSLSS